ncbi:MAG: Holliday junction resolvase RuvX [Patescibacteria group bacterium]|nr:Holliday junction resolvase RuvX [Patescibacteria group bacterium]
MQEGKLLGIDYGSKRVGLAITDPGQEIVFPRETLKNNEHLVPDLVKMCAEEGVLRVVVGLPLKIDGGDTNQSIITREFADKFVGESGLEVIFQDEAYTTFEAEQMMEGNKHLEKDSFSAMKILEHYLKKIKK